MFVRHSSSALASCPTCSHRQVCFLLSVQLSSSMPVRASNPIQTSHLLHTGKSMAGPVLAQFRGSMMERCGDRQLKCDGLERWPLHPFIESLPVVLRVPPSCMRTLPAHVVHQRLRHTYPHHPHRPRSLILRRNCNHWHAIVCVPILDISIHFSSWSMEEGSTVNRLL